MTTAPTESHAEAILKTKYLSRMYSLHLRFYRRVEKVLTVVSLAAGAAALLPVGSQNLWTP